MSTLAEKLTFSVKKYFDKELDAYVNILETGLRAEAEAWVKDVQRALGKDIPQWENKSGRTINRTRLFPYKRKGNLQRNVDTKVWSYHKGGGAVIHLRAVIGGTSGWSNSKGDGKWVGWRDATMSGKGRGNVASIRDTFTNFVQERRNIRR